MKLITKIEKTGKEISQIVDDGTFADYSVALKLLGQDPISYDQELEEDFHQEGGWA